MKKGNSSILLTASIFVMLICFMFINLVEDYEKPDYEYEKESKAYWDNPRATGLNAPASSREDAMFANIAIIVVFMIALIVLLIGAVMLK